MQNSDFEKAGTVAFRRNWLNRKFPKMTTKVSPSLPARPDPPALATRYRAAPAACAARPAAVNPAHRLSIALERIGHASKHTAPNTGTVEAQKKAAPPVGETAVELDPLELLELPERVGAARAMAIVRFELEGWHRWPDAAPHRDYLGHRHRHLFKFEIKLDLLHDEREVEFHDLLQFCRSNVCGELRPDGGREFGDRSCETIARELTKTIAARYGQRAAIVGVFEDGEVGAVISLPRVP